jgi:class 3 adenylate cyclase
MSPDDADPNGRGTVGHSEILFTDVEGSTRLWDARPAETAEALAVHGRIVREVVAQTGLVFATGTGDGFAAALRRAGDAVCAFIFGTDWSRRSGHCPTAEALAALGWPADTLAAVLWRNASAASHLGGLSRVGHATTRCRPLLGI